MINNLKILDFSRGIRDKEVMDNFRLLYDLLSRERLYSAGYGFLDGLEIKYLYPDETKQRFKFSMEEGSFINKKGEEVFKEGQDIFLEYFNTILVTETLDVNEDGSISLKDYPYVKNSWELVENNKLNNIKNNITVYVDTNINSNTVKIKDIEGRTITIDSRVANKVRVVYYTAQSRYDLVTFDENDNIKYHKGIESNSSSFYDTYKDELLLAIISYKPHEYPDKKDAIIDIIQMKELSKRKIWIDRKDGQLYLCGIPFDGTQFISIEEPEKPFLNQFWYDINTNQLKIWREVRGVEQWVIISDNSFMDVTKNKIWTPDELPKDKKTFFFNPIEERELLFGQGNNSLEIIIDNAPLMDDQYIEITKEDIKNLSEEQMFMIPKEHLLEYQKEEEKDPKYFNQGIGFMLKEALVQDAFVEVKVSHTKRSSLPETRFERSGVFIDEKRLAIPIDSKKFITDTNFLKDANQLEVYLNGKKLVNKIDYNEIEIVDSEGYYKNYCNTFELNIEAFPSDTLVYKVTGNIMSYDDLSMYMEEILEFYENASDANEKLNKKIDVLEEATKEKLSIMQNKIDSMEENITKLKELSSSLLTESKFEKTLLNKLIDIEKIGIKINLNQINSIKTLSNYMYNLDINKEIFELKITCLITDQVGENRVSLVEGLDYLINNKSIIFNNTNIIDNSIEIYIEGIAYSMKGVK